MDLLRTPDDRFANLDGYAFAPHYVEIRDDDGTPLRIHHVDEGPRDASPILLMHGNPSWSYIHRRMIGPLADAGHRVVAVDLVGLGRSDKPVKRSDYTLARHYDWMRKWLTAVDLRDVTLYGQDWGGTIGLFLVSVEPDRFERVIASNTGVPIGRGASPIMEMWVSMMRDATRFPIEDMLPQGTTRALTETEIAAYLAPYPDERFMAGIIEFPALIAVQPENPGVALNREVWERLARFEKPFLTLFGANDPMSRGADRVMQKHVAGAAGQPHHVFADAGHFIQEDVPDGLVEHILRFVAAGART